MDNRHMDNRHMDHRHMEIFASHSNPNPPGGQVIALQTRDGVTLRLAFWPANTPVIGSILIAQGRGEFIEKYLEVVPQLLARGFNVVTFDWRGQGQSQRLLADRRKGHVDEMVSYLSDLAAVELWLIEQNWPRPWFALGHSMGGALLLMRAHAGRTNFDRMLLSAPMIGLTSLKYPNAARALVRTLTAIGLGRAMVPGGSAAPYFNRPFADNVLTSDPVRYAKFATLASQAPDIWIGAPTNAWLATAFDLMEDFARTEYPMSIDIPCLIFAAGNDKVVDTKATARFVRYMKAGHMIIIPGASHEILIERDDLRAQFWAAFDEFIPGTRPAPSL